MIAAAVAPRPAHPAVAHAAVGAIGLALDEATDRRPDGELLMPDSVYSLRAGILDAGEAAIVSAMIAVTANGADVLWEQAQ